MFEQSVSEYDPHYHDQSYWRPAERAQLLLKFKGEAIGIATLDVFPDRSAATRAVAVADGKQGQGHGTALGKLTQEFAKNLGCHTLCVNAGAHVTGFYGSLGFAPQTWDKSELDGVGSPEKIVQMVLRLA